MSGSRPRGRPPRISLEQVVDAALALGLTRLSMRGLARALGVGVSSLYYYVESREELIRLVVDRVLEQLRLEALEPGDWRGSMIRSGQALRMVFASQPGMAENAFADPRWGDTIVELHEEACAHLVGVGFSPGGAFLAVRGIADLVEGHTLRKVSHDRAGTSDLDYAAAAFGSHPNLRAARRQLGKHPAEARFDFALRSLVRGMRVA